MQAMTKQAAYTQIKRINLAVGQLILISDQNFYAWGGIFKRSSYSNNNFEEEDDFLDADEADYGKACTVLDYLGVVSVDSDNALVLSDEPLLTTVRHSIDSRIVIARWFYGEDEETVDCYFKN